MSNREHTRLMRQAVAYNRLAAKAHKAGNTRDYTRYIDKSLALRAKAERLLERQRQREEQQAAWDMRTGELDRHPLR